jgi:hypothetical protein
MVEKLAKAEKAGLENKTLLVTEVHNEYLQKMGDLISVYDPQKVQHISSKPIALYFQGLRKIFSHCFGYFSMKTAINLRYFTSLLLTSSCQINENKKTPEFHATR